MLDPGRGERDRLPHQTTLAGHPERLFGVDEGRHAPSLFGEANRVDSSNLDALIEDGHPFLDGQSPSLDGDALTPGGLGQPLVEDEVDPLLRHGRILGGVKRNATAQDGGEAARLHADASQAEGALDAADVPEASIRLDEVLEARLDHQIQDHVLVLFPKTGVDDTAHLQPAEIDLGADAHRPQRIGCQVQGAPLGLITGGRAIQGIELILQRVVLPSGLQVDVVAGHQGVQAGDLGQ